MGNTGLTTTRVSRHWRCGHPRRTAHRDCPYCAALRKAIAWGMRYWFSRVILGASNTESQAWAHYTPPAHWRLDQRCAIRNWRRGVIRRLRARGASNWEVRAAIHGRPLDVQKEIILSRASCQRYRDRWGGDPSSIGSAAWRRRELTRYWRQQGRTDLAEEVV